jgi:hypothetical protein
VREDFMLDLVRFLEYVLFRTKIIKIFIKE